MNQKVHILFCAQALFFIYFNPLSLSIVRQCSCTAHLRYIAVARIEHTHLSSHMKKLAYDETKFS